MGLVTPLTTHVLLAHTQVAPFVPLHLTWIDPRGGVVPLTSQTSGATLQVYTFPSGHLLGLSSSEHPLGVGVAVGVLVGVLVGVSVGVFVGVSVGVFVGVSVGVFVGVLVG
ncbi:MAG: hypothetical protein K0S99_1363, partial [Thermomicrobiales bacterium]|nr:hypothetical protein [Thermomicrobiales bacterium]